MTIHIDLSADYCRLAEWRTADPKERARVLKKKPPQTTSTTHRTSDVQPITPVDESGQDVTLW